MNDMERRVVSGVIVQAYITFGVWGLAVFSGVAALADIRKTKDKDALVAMHDEVLAAFAEKA